MFHEGELAIQERAGARALAEAVGGMIAERIPVGGRAFLAGQPMLVTAAAADDGAVWAGLVAGAPGFARSSPDGRAVDLALAATHRSPEPVAWRAGTELGLLAIELATRRRLRINGSLAEVSPERAVLAVAEAFPNCPKYITRRPIAATARSPSAASDRGTELDAERLALLARIDTAFVASRNPAGHADASHRGGPAGFVTALDAHTLLVPDYAGNGLFQTLGNLAVDPAVGLALLDFARGRLLQITGRATLAITAEARSWQVAIDRWLESPLPVAG